MRTLIRLNVVLGLCFAVELIAIGSGGGGLVDLAWLATVVAISILLPVELGIGLARARREGRRAFVPVASLAASAVAGWGLGVLGTQLVLWQQGFPHDPHRFMSGGRKQELTRAANDLLAAGVPRSDWQALPESLARVLREHRIQELRVCPQHRIVLLGYARRRTWYRYVYMEGAVLDRLPPVPPLGEASIRDWNVLADVVRRPEGAGRSEDGWAAARAELARALPPGAMERLETRTAAAALTAEDRRQVIAALQSLVAADSGLSQRFTAASLATAPPACGRWVDAVSELLAREGVLRGAPPKLSANLTPGARRGVEWLHSGLVCSLFGGFGGLVAREPHLAADAALDQALRASARPLGDGWFFAYD